MPTPPPIFVPPSSEVEVLPAAVSARNQLDVDGIRPTARPGRTARDVWRVMREYTEQGGLLDLTEDVATYSALEQEIREDDLGTIDRVNLLTRVVERRVRAKQAHIQVQKDRNAMITQEAFMAFLGDLFEVLQRHVGHDVGLLRLIGEDMGLVVERMRSRLDSGA